MNAQIPQLPGGAPAGGGDIDLGETPEGLGENLPTPTPEAPPAEPNYPSVMLRGGPELAKIPDKGRSIIHHSVVSRRRHTPEHGRHKGKERHEVEMKLHKIRPLRAYKKAESKSKRSDDENAMRELMGDTEEQ